MANTDIFYASGERPKMIEAFQKARDTFKYFWRELFWERNRIIPALNMACVKIAFTQLQEGGDYPIVEHMWINDVQFDGEQLEGVLVNEPNQLTNVNNGDWIKVSVDQISDWLFSIQAKTYGGFTIQAMRSEMTEDECIAHDEAWGLDFRDYNDILWVYEQKEHPENLIEHPMSISMREKLIDFLKQYPEELTGRDAQGYQMLHREAIAGNKTSIEVLKELGVDLKGKTESGKTALDFAKQLNWDHIIPLL